MDALLLFLIPILAIVAAVVSRIPRDEARRTKVFFLTMGIPLTIFFGDEIIGHMYLHAKCTINGGYTYKEEIKAEGYFDADYDKGCGLACLEALTRWGFSYYETEVRYNYPYHANKNGVYKYYLADKGLGYCAGGKEIPREKRIMPDGKCVAYKIMEKPSSRYELSMIGDTDIVKRPFRMTKVFSYVRDRKTGDIVASATSYRYWGGWVRSNSFGHNSASGCPSFEESHGVIENKIFAGAGERKTPNKLLHPTPKSGAAEF